MNDKIPRSPFSTALSGSARETEDRIRNIFSGPKKRPPALFLALIFAVCLLCGNLISCQAPESTQPDASVSQPWDDPDLADDTARWMLYWEEVTPKLFAQREDYDPEYSDGEILLTQQGNSLNLLLAAWTPGAHVGGWRNLLLGTFDQDGEPVDFYELRGDSGLWSSWEENGVLHLLCCNTSNNHGWETSTAPMYFRFDGKTLESVEQTPQTGWKQLGNVPQSLSQWADWGDHKYLPRPGVIDVYQRTDGWDNTDPAFQNVPQWEYLGVVHFSERSADPVPAPVHSAARDYIDAAVLQDIPAAGSPILRLEQKAEWDDFSLLSWSPDWRDKENLKLTAWDLDYGDPARDGSYVGHSHLLFAQNGDKYTFLTPFYDHNDPIYGDAEPGLLAGLSPYNWYAVEALYDSGFLTARPKLADIFTKVPAPLQAWSLAAETLETTENQKVWLHLEDDYYWVTDLGLAHQLLSDSFPPFAENALCLESMEPVRFVIEEPGWLGVYALETSRFQSGKWEKQETLLAFFEIASFRSFQTCWRICPESEVSDIEQAARAAYHGLLDYEVALWDLSYYPYTSTAYGPGNYDGVFTAQGSEELTDGWREWGDRYEATFQHSGRNGRFCISLDTTRRLPTTRGAKLGDSRERVRALYPELRAGNYPGLDGDYLWYCAGEPESHSSLIFFFENDAVSRLLLNAPLNLLPS